MSGKAAQRGFIVQTVVAIIECLERNDWDEIKMEPETNLDQVDFRLYSNNEECASIQVKSSTLRFGPTEVKEWLAKIQKDTGGNREKSFLYLVGDKFSQNCDDYIAESQDSIKKISLATLEDNLASALISYVHNNRFDININISDLVYLEDVLFSLIHRNSIERKRIRRETFENLFQSTIRFVPYGKYYQERALRLSNTTNPYYVRNDYLHRIINDFFNYRWTDEVCLLLRKLEFENDIDEIWEVLMAILKQDKLFDVRRNELLQYLTEKKGTNIDEGHQRKVRKFAETIKKLSFGNCLFLSGRYGIGKTCLLKKMISESVHNNRYICYHDLIEADGKFDEAAIRSLIRKYFGWENEDSFSFVSKFITASGENETIVFAIDNLDYAFQRGLQPKTLIELLRPYSICEKIKWIFTIQSEQRYLIWQNNAMNPFAKAHGFVSKNDDDQGYFKGVELDMDSLSEKARVFERILQKALFVADDFDEDICLRKNHKYDAYLNPYFAELLIRLGWDWRTIANVKHLAYQELCQNYKILLLDNISEFDKSNCSVYARRMKASNLCITIGEQQIRTGSNTWFEEEAHYEKELLTPLLGVGVIIALPMEEPDGRCQTEYVAADKLFWAEQTAETVASRSKAFSLQEKMDLCGTTNNPIARLPYFIDFQRLYLLLLLHKNSLFNKINQQSIWKGILPEEIKWLFSPNIYPRMAEALSFASKEEQQEMFFYASLLLFHQKGKSMTESESYMYYSTFFEFCGTIQLLANDWKNLICVLPTELSENQMERTLEDFAVLLRKKRSELSIDLLSKILVQLGNIDAAFSEYLAETIAGIYFDLCQDYEQLISMLLQDSGLCKMKKLYSIAGRSRDFSKGNRDSFGRPVTRNAYPYCLLENTISIICDRIITSEGVWDGHRLFWDTGWYEQEWNCREPQFFLEVRRKSLNLSLTNTAKYNRYRMEELEHLIYSCLHKPEEKGNVQRVYREEALFLCRNSVLADERSPLAFTDTIYDYLIKFVTDSHMQSFMRQKSVRRFYARHNLFALFLKCEVRLKLKHKGESFACIVEDYTRESIIIRRNKEEYLEEITWNEIDMIYDVNDHRQPPFAVPGFSTQSRAASERKATKKASD